MKKESNKSLEIIIQNPGRKKSFRRLLNPKNLIKKTPDRILKKNLTNASLPKINQKASYRSI
jgi:hypothetical protein